MKTRTYFTDRIDVLDAGGGRDRRERSSKKRRLSAAGSREQYRI
jgi:hypothetical protein